MIKKLPPLPQNIMYLDISNTDIKEYPKDVPDTVVSLFVTGTPIWHIDRLPKSLISLDIHDSPIETLPELHEGLEEIYISGTSISSISSLPSTLKILSAYNIKNLRSLPPLPHKLEEIFVDNTPLVLLHDLPASISMFDCRNCPNLLVSQGMDDPATYRARWDNYFKTNSIKSCKLIKEELMMNVYHPDRIWNLIEKHGIDILDCF
jgi:Leucine-rich repeat (LRR) protein